VIREICSPCTNPWGLAYDGGNLLISDDSLGRIYTINFNGEVLDTMDVPCSAIKGMTFKDNELWIVNSDAVDDTLIFLSYDSTYHHYYIHRIYKINRYNGVKIDSIDLIANGENAGRTNFLWGDSL